MHMRNPSNEAVKATINTICRSWAKRLEDAFHPGISASDLCQALSETDRYEEDMRYLLANAQDPYALVIEARLQAHP